MKTAGHLMGKVEVARLTSDRMNHSLEERLANYEFIGLDQYIATWVTINPLNATKRILEVIYI